MARIAARRTHIDRLLTGNRDASYRAEIGFKTIHDLKPQIGMRLYPLHMLGNVIGVMMQEPRPRGFTPLLVIADERFVQGYQYAPSIRPDFASVIPSSSDAALVVRDRVIT